jgi:4-amino-4-deoxy-L-arabinose transferase-like glycosyltransferase
MIAQDTPHSSFRQFLSTYRVPILIILLLAFGWRLVLVIGFPREAGDEKRYTVPAINMLAGHGFSSDVREPILPSEHTVPLYSLFIATVYAVFGQNNSAVRIAQSAIDLITCLLVAFVSFRLAPPRLRESAAFLGLIIYGLLCWFTVSWTRHILTETLATFVTMLAVAVSIMVLRRERWRWLVVGLICGVALMTRADSVLLIAAFGLILLIQIARLRTSKSVANLLLFCGAIPLVLAPWIARNYIALGKFQPLASAEGLPHGEYVPQGYLLWIRTWMTDQTHYLAYHPAIFPGSRDFDPRRLPDKVFDSAEERERVVLLIDRYNETGRFEPEMSDEFQAIANARIKRAPMRFFVWLPIQRIAGMWLTGFATTNAFHRLLRITLVLPILIGGIVGFAFLTQNSRLVQLLLVIILTRTLFFGFLNSSEHYIVEAYPPVIAACGVTCAVLWSSLRQRLPVRRSGA